MRIIDAEERKPVRVDIEKFKQVKGIEYIWVAEDSKLIVLGVKELQFNLEYVAMMLQRIKEQRILNGQTPQSYVVYAMKLDFLSKSDTEKLAEINKNYCGLYGVSEYKQVYKVMEEQFITYKDYTELKREILTRALVK